MAASVTQKGKPRRSGKTVSEAEFRRMWGDATLSQVEIGRRLGITSQAVRFRAKTRNLPPRPNDRLWARSFDHNKAVRLYQAGLSRDAVGQALGGVAVQYALARAGVQCRDRHDPATLSAEDVARAVLAAAARQEQAAFRLAEMVDHLNPHASGKPMVRSL